MTKAIKTSPCSPPEAKSRAEVARAYLETAKAVLAEKRDKEDAFLSAAAGNAVLAGIAASDAICGRRLARIHRGDDHKGAIHLLRSATPDGKALAATLGRLLELKQAAHYGAPVVSKRRVSDAIRWAEELVDRATTEIQR